MNLAMHPFVLAAVHGVVWHAMFPSVEGIGRKRVGIERFGIAGDVLLQEFPNFAAAAIGDCLEADLPIARGGANHDGLAARATATSLLLAAQERLVHLDNAGKRLLMLIVHCGADAMAQEPSGLVTHLEHALELIRADAFAALDHHVD